MMPTQSFQKLNNSMLCAAAINKRQRVLAIKKGERKVFGVSLAPEARRMAPCGMSSSLPLPEGFLLFVVR